MNKTLLILALTMAVVCLLSTNVEGKSRQCSILWSYKHKNKIK